MAASDLPVVSILPALHAALADTGAAVLVAPPGSGKTTRVPIALLAAGWLGGRRIVMLEPRRLAARAAAAYMASLLGSRVGETVGYRVRGDTRVGRETRIEVVTEGVLTRVLQDDPSMEGIGAVIFDEFHERSVHADLGLAITLHARSVLRPDVRVLVMSATLDAAPIAALLGDAPVIAAEGRAFPVDVEWRTQPVEGHIEPAVATTVRRALAEHPGDVLVFLPGAAEIGRVERMLADDALHGVDVAPLHGGLPLSAQDRAIRPAPPGRRRIVLATSIAETSLTIEGVRVVVDSGLARVPRFSPRTGLVRLATTRVPRSSAEQRRGRAGRLAPGVCYRLWTEAEHAALLERPVPGILEADLVPLALELAVWGADATELAWLDPPPEAALAQAHELLRELDALAASGAATAHGRALAGVPLHPRLAHMVLRSDARGLTGLACDIAGLLSERDALRWRDGQPDPDLRRRVDALRALRAGRHVPRDFDVGTLRRALAEADRLRGRHAHPGDDGVDETGRLVALAYPDRVGMLRTDARGRFLLRNGRGATVDAAWPLAAEPLLAAAEVEGHGRDSRIRLAAPLDPNVLREEFAGQIETREIVELDDDAGTVRALRREVLGALVLRETPSRAADPERVTDVLLEVIARRGIDRLPWSKGARGIVQRIRFARSLDEGAWPDASDEALTASLGTWLRPHLAGTRRLQDVDSLDLEPVLSAWLGWEKRRALDDLAPTHVPVPTGSRLPIDYSDPAAPVLAVRLQEMFGLAETPRIAHGRVPLTLHLLSPARRPVQVTRDLAGFWSGSYAEVRKEMRGRYPKHPWPENPLEAEPTRRTKNR